MTASIVLIPVGAIAIRARLRTEARARVGRLPPRRLLAASGRAAALALLAVPPAAGLAARRRGRRHERSSRGLSRRGSRRDASEGGTRSVQSRRRHTRHRGRPIRTSHHLVKCRHGGGASRVNWHDATRTRGGAAGRVSGIHAGATDNNDGLTVDQGGVGAVTRVKLTPARSMRSAQMHGAREGCVVRRVGTHERRSKARRTPHEGIKGFSHQRGSRRSRFITVSSRDSRKYIIRADNCGDDPVAP